MLRLTSSSFSLIWFYIIWDLFKKNLILYGFIHEGFLLDRKKQLFSVFNPQ